MAQQGKKVLLIGCDPKSDTTSLLFGGKACPTIIETASAKKAAGDEVSVGDVCFKRDGAQATMHESSRGAQRGRAQVALGERRGARTACLAAWLMDTTPMETGATEGGKMRC